MESKTLLSIVEKIKISALRQVSESSLRNLVDEYGNGPLLTAVIHGRIAVFCKLADHTQLPLSERNNHGEGLVTKAIIANQGAMLEVLVRRYQCSLDYQKNNNTDLIETAIVYNRAEILSTLLRPIAQEGYGCDIYDIDYYLQLAEQYQRPAIFVRLVLGYFSLVESQRSSAEAVAWLASTYLNQTFARSELQEAVKNLIKLFIKSNKVSLADNFVQMIERHSTGEYYFFLASLYNEKENFTKAASYYQKVYQNKASHFSGDAGIELAILIRHDKLSFPLENAYLENSANGINPQQERIIKAIEYVFWNNSSKGKDIRLLLYKMLSHDPVSMKQAACWPLAVINRFYNYYATKNPSLLESIEDSELLTYVLDEKLNHQVRASTQSTIKSGVEFFPIIKRPSVGVRTRQSDHALSTENQPFDMK